MPRATPVVPAAARRSRRIRSRAPAAATRSRRMRSRAPAGRARSLGNKAGRRRPRTVRLRLLRRRRRPRAALRHPKHPPPQYRRKIRQPAHRRRARRPRRRPVPMPGPIDPGCCYESGPIVCAPFQRVSACCFGVMEDSPEPCADHAQVTAAGCFEWLTRALNATVLSA